MRRRGRGNRPTFSWLECVRRTSRNGAQTREDHAAARPPRGAAWLWRRAGGGGWWGKRAPTPGPSLCLSDLVCKRGEGAGRAPHSTGHGAIAGRNSAGGQGISEKFPVSLLSKHPLGKRFLFHLMITEPFQTTPPPKSPTQPRAPGGRWWFRERRRFPAAGA